MTPAGREEHGGSVKTRERNRKAEGAMRRAGCLVLLTALAGAACAQQTGDKKEIPVVVRKLTLTAIDKPNADWHPMAAPFEGGSYLLDDLHDRIQQKLRDNGYYLVHLEPAQLENVRQESGGRSADVSVQMEVGDQYTMGQISFRHSEQLKKEQMRSVFPIAAGSVFNASAISVGIEKLKNLYEAQGFADVGAVPSMAVDDANHVIDISVEVEEGYPYLFGALTLEGPEPVPGTNKALLAAWSEIAGKRYNPETLKKWLGAHAPKGAPGAPAIHPHAEGIADTEAHLMNVRMVY